MNNPDSSPAVGSSWNSVTITSIQMGLYKLSTDECLMDGATYEHCRLDKYVVLGEQKAKAHKVVLGKQKTITQIFCSIL